MPGPTRTFGAWALAAAAALGAPATASADQAKVQIDRASARLVLEWPRPVDYAVSRNGAHIFVRFSRPFAGTLQAARAPLARYLAELRLAGGGRVLVMRLAGEPRFAHQRRGNAVILTWIGTVSPERAAPQKPAAAATRPTPARRATAPENPTDSGDPPARTGAAPQEPVRPPAVLRQEPPKRPPAPPEMHAARPPQPNSGAPALKSPMAEAEGRPDRPATPPPVRANPGPAEPRDGTDAATARPRPQAPYTDALLPPARPTAPPQGAERPVPPPERAQPSAPAPRSPGVAGDALPPRPAAPPETRAERPAIAEPEKPAPAAPSAPRAEAARLPQSMAKVPEAQRPKLEVRPAPAARPAPDGPLEPPVMPAISPILNVTRAGTETRIVLAWPEPVAAAVFRHGDHVWMVFPRREAFDVEKVQGRLGPGVARLVRVEHAQATVLAARARPDMQVRVAHERNVWTIALKPGNGTPALPDVKLAISRNGIEQAALPLPGAETPIRFVAPDTGGILHVVPSRATAAAGGERAFVTFRILPAAQGGVIEALADGLVVGAESGAMTIRRSAGLLLSNGGPPGAAPDGQ